MANYRTFFLLCMIVIGGGTYSINALAVFAKPIKPDLRILIDASESMQFTDPDNLRRDAAALMLERLPDGSRSGVWTFADDADSLVRPGVVDKQWRAVAESRLSEINALGQYSNIGLAIEAAISDWHPDQHQYRRVLVLITDGKVDVSQDDKIDAAARTHILEKLLPKLVKRGVQVHTVALSHEADLALLKRMAYETQGKYLSLTGAAELHSGMLDVLNDLVASDRVPIENKQFTIDPSVNELQLVLFATDRAQALQLKPPGYPPFNQYSRPKDVDWKTDGLAEIITLKNPTRGNWEILGEFGGNARAYIKTSRNLVVEDLPSQIFSGESLNFRVGLLENGELDGSGVKFSGQLWDRTQSVAEYDFGDKNSQDPRLQGGWYSEIRAADYPPGEYRLSITAKGENFARRMDYPLTIHRSPIEIEESISAAGDIVIDISSKMPWLNPADVEMYAELKDAEQFNKKRLIAKRPNHWRYILSAEDIQKPTELTFALDGRTKTGRWVRLTTPVKRVLPEKMSAQAAQLNDGETGLGFGTAKILREIKEQFEAHQLEMTMQQTQLLEEAESAKDQAQQAFQQAQLAQEQAKQAVERWESEEFKSLVQAAAQPKSLSPEQASLAPQSPSSGVSVMAIAIAVVVFNFMLFMGGAAFMLMRKRQKKAAENWLEPGQEANDDE